LPPYGYIWAFGDGGSSTAQNPSHIYTSAGSYVASVTVTDMYDRAAHWTSPTITVSMQDQAPTVPGIPHLQTPGDELDGTFTLTWTASVDNDQTPLLYYYLIEMSNTGGGWGGGWHDISQTLTTNSIILTRAPGSYVYAVNAVDTAGKWSGWAQMPIPPSPFANPIVVPEPPGPPVTTASLSGMAGGGGWYRSVVSVTLTATDPNGVQDTFYKIDSARKWTRYTGPFQVSKDAKHTVYFYSVDTQGYTETTKSVSVWIDTTAPSTTASSKGTATKTVTLKATDTASGVASTYYSLDYGTTWLLYTAPFKVTGSGSHTVLFYSLDIAGNQESVKTYTFTIR
jgi:PKD repeat protein